MRRVDINLCSFENFVNSSKKTSPVIVTINSIFPISVDFPNGFIKAMLISYAVSFFNVLVLSVDFAKGFIKADVISYDDYLHYKSEDAIRAAGKLRSEGKDYVVDSNEVLFFKFQNRKK